MLASFPAPSPTTPPHLTLLMKSFQSLFPPLSPHTLALSSARRVVLISYNAERGTVDFRHYVITVKPYGVSKRVRRVLEGAQKASGGILDLGNEKDVADFLLRKRGEAGPDGGYESAASSTESVAGDDGDAVDLADDYVGRNNKKGQRRAVRLDEVGPRMELRLVKITEGVPGKEGSVIYHEFGASVASQSWQLLLMSFAVKKTKKEAANQQAAHAAKEKLRKERRAEQERNVERKKAKGKVDGGEEEEDEEEEDEDEDMEYHGEGDDDAEWDAEEEISEGENSDEEGAQSDESEDEQQPPAKKARGENGAEPRGAKKVRIRGKR